ncbi:MAG TPA: LPXTG cell wall anchor domain-containing protein [Solirubrobacteraceae bacterium]|nr:LPXTG cell wall anchor domain-containing protein [Solirubrobacteraceae bacterium]
MPPVPRRAVAALLLATALAMPAAAAAQTTTIPDEGAGVTTTPPVPLPGERPPPESARELPNTGADARLLFLAGLALTLIGFGLRLRTADADDY